MERQSRYREGQGKDGDTGMSISQMSRKLFITLVLILFLLPFLSWYYLQQGLNWRKKAQVMMSGIEHFPEGEWVATEGRTFSSTQLEQHVTLVTLMDCNNHQEMAQTLDEFYNQFKATQKSNFIVLDHCDETKLIMTDKSDSGIYLFSCSDSTGLCRALLEDWPTGKTHALVDKHQVIRSYYTAKTKEEKRILLEHMALLLPRDRSEKVELKRGDRQ